MFLFTRTYLPCPSTYGRKTSPVTPSQPGRLSCPLWSCVMPHDGGGDVGAHTRLQLKSTASVAVVGSKAAFETYNAEAGDEDKLDVVDPFAQE